MWMTFIFAAFSFTLVWICFRFINLLIYKNDMKPLRKYFNSKLSKKIHIQFIHIFIDTWILWARVGLRKYSPFISEKILIISISLVSVIIGALFESSLTSVYMKPLYYNDINTLEEFDKSGLNILYKFHAMKDDLFPSNISVLYDSLRKKMIFYNETNFSILKNLAKNSGNDNYGGVTRETTINIEDVEYFILNKIYKVPECPKTYILAYLLQKHSPYATRINYLLALILSSGLFEKWKCDVIYEAKLKRQKINDKEISMSFKILNLNDLQLSFYIITFGNILSILIFFIERYYHLLLYVFAFIIK